MFYNGSETLIFATIMFEIMMFATKMFATIMSSHDVTISPFYTQLALSSQDAIAAT